MQNKQPGMSVALEKVRNWLDTNGQMPCLACGCPDRIVETNAPIAVLPTPN